MKVVFNTWSGAFFNPGGGETQLVETRRHLEQQGVEVDLYDQWKPQRDVDVFHQFSINEGVNFPLAEYKAMGVKTAVSTILWADFQRGSPEYDRVRRVIGLADILFSNSKAESDKLSITLDIDRAKFHETRNGVSSAFMNMKTNKDFREHFKLPGDFILSVANIDRRKNTHSLIEACQQLGKPLVLVGHIRDQDYYQSFASKINGSIRYLGPVADVDLLKSAYQQTLLFALPSLCETPGIAALEAASQGARIAITSEGCAKEYFGKEVTYVNPFDQNSITDGIAGELNQDRDLAALVGAVTSTYTWEKAADDVRRGYERLRG